ncbi:MAG: hypothetical protein U9R15_10135 [Chloroflexota bacterium]|nr:hypothetical protein [Chloroflexota bacterium]
MSRENDRQDPFQSLSGEPVEDLTTGVVPSALRRPPTTGGRKTPIRPSEARRRKRKLTITFSTGAFPERVRDLARRWNLYASNGKPNGSAVVEYLLGLNLEAAERGEVAPPGSDQDKLPQQDQQQWGEQWF